jgi:hypothetical protein
VSTDRDVTRIVRSWLEEGATTLPDHVLDDVLDRVPTTPQRRASWPAQMVPIRGLFLAATAAAAVLVVAVTALAFGPWSPSGTEVSPTPTQSASPSATAAAGIPIDTTTIGQTLASGTYTVGSPFDIGFELTVTGRWKVLELRDGQFSIGEPTDTYPYLGFFLARDVPVDPCHPDSGSRSPFDPPDASTLVNSLRLLEGFQAGPITTLTIDGQMTRHFTLSNSIDTESSNCTNGQLLPLFDELGDGPASTNGGTSLEIWVVDVVPRPVLIVGETGSDARPAMLELFDEILRTVNFE